MAANQDSENTKAHARRFVAPQTRYIKQAETEIMSMLAEAYTSRAGTPATSLVTGMA